MSTWYYLIPLILVGAILLRTIRRRLNDGDLIIRCKHCRAKIDTTIHAACPNCGRDYEEERYAVQKDMPFVSWEEANAEERAEEKRQKSMCRLNKLQLAGIFLALAGLVPLLTDIPSLGFRRPKTKEVGVDDGYRRASYGFVGDRVIVENEKVKVTLKAIYEEPTLLYPNEFGEDYGTAKVEFEVENKSEDALDIRFRSGGVNGLMSTYGSHDFIGKFEKKSTTTVYETIYEVPGGKIGELVYGELRISNYKDYDFFRAECRRYRTDAPTSSEPPKVFGTLKYEGNGVRVYTAPYPGEANGESGYLLQVVNESGTDYTVNANEKGYGDSATGVHLYEVVIPNGYVLRKRMLKSRNDENPTPNYDVSLSFRHWEDPSKDFSTGYFTTTP